MLVEGSNKRTYALDRHAGVVSSVFPRARHPLETHVSWQRILNVRLTALLYATRQWREWRLTVVRW